jgi:hypothetical protein
MDSTLVVMDICVSAFLLVCVSDAADKEKSENKTRNDVMDVGWMKHGGGEYKK